MTRSIPYTQLVAEILHLAAVTHLPGQPCPSCRVHVCPRCSRLIPADRIHTCPTPTTKES